VRSHSDVQRRTRLGGLLNFLPSRSRVSGRLINRTLRARPICSFETPSSNARNALADTKPPERRRVAEGFFEGPVGTSGRMSFMLSANDERDDNQAFIYAL
jgi:hypothetical protein